MNKDAKKEHCYFVFFHTSEDEIKARVHSKWITSHFPQAKVQSPISFPIKVNRARANAVLDANTGRVADNAKDSVSNSNGGLKITWIGWLSKLGTGKLYRSMVVCLADKMQADAFLEKGVTEVGGETAYTEPWQEISSEEKRCFNCQQYGHEAAVCVRIPVCGNCAARGHSHRNCTNLKV